jgi:prepilin-type N-terminal cleavage/methylation domain-containing protein
LQAREQNPNARHLIRAWRETAFTCRLASPEGPSIINHQSSIANRHGFTLIELLVVIGIIAILLAIFMPVASRARAQVRAAICQSNLRQWGTVLDLYAQDNNGQFPSDGTGASGATLIRGTILRSGDANVPEDSVHGFQTRGIALCPMAVKLTTKVGSFSASMTAQGGAESVNIKGTSGGAFTAWEITEPTPRFRGSYGYNSWLFKGFCADPVRTNDGVIVGLDVLSCKGRANIPVILDSASLVDVPAFADTQSPPPVDDTRSFFINRHKGCINSLFLDWSVRRVGLKELWTLKWNRDFNTAGRWTKAGGITPERWPAWMRGFKDY